MQVPGTEDEHIETAKPAHLAPAEKQEHPVAPLKAGEWQACVAHALPARAHGSLAPAATSKGASVPNLPGSANMLSRGEDPSLIPNDMTRAASDVPNGHVSQYVATRALMHEGSSPFMPYDAEFYPSGPAEPDDGSGGN